MVTSSSPTNHGISMRCATRPSFRPRLTSDSDPRVAAPGLDRGISPDLVRDRLVKLGHGLRDGLRSQSHGLDAPLILHPPCARPRGGVEPRARRRCERFVGDGQDLLDPLVRALTRGGLLAPADRCAHYGSEGAHPFGTVQVELEELADRLKFALIGE